MQTINSCGGCTACCTACGVQSIRKLPHTPCYLCTGDGCSVYEDRPLECRNFQCSWLQGIAGGSDYRPDRTGVVPWHRSVPELGMVLVLSEFHPGALNSEFTFKWTRRNTRAGNFTVHHPIQGNCRMYFPRGVVEVRGDFEKQWGRGIDYIPFAAVRGLVL